MNSLGLKPTMTAWPATGRDAARSERDILLGLVRREWTPFARVHLGFFLGWLIGIWVLQLVNHPGWLIAFGLTYTAFVAPTLAGADVLRGTEEFSFAQPPGRGPLFLARLTIGLVFLAATTGIGAVATAFDAPQLFWSIVASSGITEPNPNVQPRCLFPLGLLVPAAAFSGTFALASLARSRLSINLSWLGGFAGTGALAMLSFLIESFLWNKPVGWIICPSLALASVVTLLSSYHAYLEKEAVIGGGHAASNHVAVWVTLSVIVLALVLLLFMSFVAVRKHEADRVEAIQSRAAKQFPATE